MKLSKSFIYIFLFYFSFLQAKDSFATKSGNVIQGIAYFNKNWIFSQTHNNKSITFSILDNKLKLKQTINIRYPSHAQDLSVVQLNNKMYLLTTGKHWLGIAIFELNKIDNKYKITFQKHLKLGIGKNTPTISTDGNYIATTANNSVYIFDFKTLNEKYAPKPLFSFVLDELQRQKGQWRQGIVMRDNKIYISSGDADIEHPKYLVIYDAYGKVLDKIKLKLDIEKAKKEGNKLEVEGLTFKGNELYTAVMTGHNGNNIKRLHKIIKVP